jgi:hypothetical protein
MFENLQGNVSHGKMLAQQLNQIKQVTAKEQNSLPAHLL